MQNQSRVDVGNIRMVDVPKVMSKYPKGTVVDFSCEEADTPEKRDEVTRLLNESIGFLDQQTTGPLQQS